MLNNKEKETLGLKRDADGIIRRIDCLGRIVIPKEMVDKHRWITYPREKQTEFEVMDYGGIIVLKPIS